MVDLLVWLAYGVAMLILGMFLEASMRPRDSWIRRLWWDLYDRYRILRRRVEAWHRR